MVRPLVVLGAVLVALIAGRPAMAGIFPVTSPHDPRVAGAVIVDTRAVSVCGRRSLAGAHCLSPEDVLGPHGRLADFRDILWVLGADGLSGKGTVLVAGDSPDRRDFVAGLLYLAGQKQVAVLTRPLTPLIAARGVKTAPGTPKGMIRNPIFGAWPRAGLVVLRTELAHAIDGAHPPMLLDGRTLSAYWGRRIRALRGGHIPGAQPLPMDRLRLAMAKGTVVRPGAADIVAYGADPYRSIAYFALLRLAGIKTRVYMAGWRDWAAHTALPVDAETYPDYEDADVAPVPAFQNLATGEAIVLIGIGLLLAAAAFHLGRSRA